VLASREGIIHFRHGKKIFRGCEIKWRHPAR
jgi:hypothetical protein